MTTVYVLVALAGLAAKPTAWFSEDAAQDAGLSQILNDVTGSTIWGTILAAGAVISIFSVTLVTLYGQTRILFAIGRDGLAFMLATIAEFGDALYAVTAGFAPPAPDFVVRLPK